MVSMLKLSCNKSILFLLLLIAGMALSLSGCGQEPSVKVQEPNAVKGALNFSQLPPDPNADPYPEVGVVYLGQSIDSLAPHGDFTGEFTIEGMVQSHAANIKGGIFSRSTDDAGILLYVDTNSIPKFAMKKSGQNPYIVDSGFTLVNNEWTHVAGSLTTEDHTTGPNAHNACLGSGTGWTTSIAVDSSNEVHISYIDSTNNLHYAKGILGSWDTSKIDPTTVVGNVSTSIDTNSANIPHISYYDTIAKELMHTTNATGSWVKQVVDIDPAYKSVGEHNSLAVNTATNRVYMTYYAALDGANNPARDPRYAIDSAGSFPFANLTTIGEGGSVDAGKYISMAVDSAGEAYMSFYKENTQDLTYTTGHLFPSYTFHLIRLNVDTTGSVGKFTSIAKAASGGGVHISYYDETNTALKFATCAGSCNLIGSWTAITLDNAADVGQYTSIVSDSVNKISISYYDATNGNLKLATCSGSCNILGSWSISTIDNSANDVGKYSSIDVDSTNNLHISYFNATNMNLLYATNQGGIWSYNIVDAGDPRTDATHLDIFVNGNFMNCATTSGNFSDSMQEKNELNGYCLNGSIASDPSVEPVSEAIGLQSGGWPSFPVGPFNNLNASVDEVRFWAVPRTETEIKQCMGQELTISQGKTCSINNAKLKGYWRFNEGFGSEVMDHSGSGNGGEISWCDGRDNDLINTNIGDFCTGDVDCGGPTADFSTWTSAWTLDSAL